MTKKELIIAALLILPTVVLSGIVAKNEIDKSTAQTWRVKITGYDPRDLLYGHYLNFRYDWGADLGQCQNKEECVLCFMPKEGAMAPQVSYKSGSEAKTCQSAIDVSGTNCMEPEICDDESFNPTGPQRYYIPENAAGRLNAILMEQKREVAVDLKVTPSGRHMLSGLYIDQIEWREYLRQNPEAGRKPSRREVTPSAPNPEAEKPREIEE